MIVDGEFFDASALVIRSAKGRCLYVLSDLSHLQSEREISPVPSFIKRGT